MSVHNIYIFKPLKKSIHLLLLICLLYDPCFAQNKFTISGFIKDEKGEELIGASIYIDSLNAGTISNAYGFYSITLPENLYKVSYSYMGYQNITRSINLDKNITVNIDLEPASQDITEVEITSQNKSDNIQSVGM